MRLSETLSRHFPLLFEGALGTELIRRGLPEGAPADQMTLDHPECVCAIHRAYIAAGAKVLQTNTFNANRPRLGQLDLEDRFEQLNRRAVDLARDAARGDCRVAASLGPTGIRLAPGGHGNIATMTEAYTEQARMLADAGADLLLVETMYDLREALAALRACRAVCDLPVIVTLTFTRTPHGFLTLVGDAAGDALRALAEAGAGAIGTNCNLDCATTAALARRLREFLPNLPILVQPCAGQPQFRADTVEYPDTPEVYSYHMRSLADIGIEMLGGCCGTTPEHIRRLRAVLDERSAS